MKKITISKTIILVFVCLVCCHLCWGQDTTTAKWKPCTPKNAFGLDLGIGLMDKSYLNENLVTYDIGMRYLHHFTPYIGMDFIKFNSKFSLKNQIPDYAWNNIMIDYFSCNVQWMLGVRGNTPAFFKCMSGYAASRVGFGFVFESKKYPYFYDYNDEFSKYYPVGEVTSLSVGYCLETEIGLNITKELFIGYSLNGQFERKYASPDVIISHTFRIGVNIK